MVNGDAALSQQLLDVTVEQALAQIPPHRHHDDLTRKAEPSKARPQRRHSTVATTHQHSLPPAGHPPAQQSPGTTTMINAL